MMQYPSALLRLAATFLILLVNTTFAGAQNEGYAGTTAGNENLLRSNGLIYVVVGVIVIILLGMILYLVGIDRKISKMEKEK